MLAGLKTYLTAALAALVAIIGYFTGTVSLVDAVTALGLATGLYGARSVTHAIEILAIVKDPTRMTFTPGMRQYITYGGTAIAVLSAVLGFWNGATDLQTAIAAVLAALGINFLSIGAKSSAEFVAKS
jgi:hypothetical protein